MDSSDIVCLTERVCLRGLLLNWPNKKCRQKHPLSISMLANQLNKPVLRLVYLYLNDATSSIYLNLNNAIHLYLDQS